jgi:NhaP-type Na+/H+ or K+/H+ antiporter
VELTVVVVVTATIFLWGLVSARLERADLTAPIVFTVIGALVAFAGLVDTPAAPDRLKPLVETTLVWVLFSDAARIRIQDFRRGLGLYVRLLAIGLPLTVVAGWGLAFGAVAGRRGPAELQFLEQASGLVSLLVWFAFGAIAVPIMVERIDLAIIAYAVLSLTAVRMVPVSLALIGTGFDHNTVLFVGWFGPRGLASLVFALLSLEALGQEADQAVAVIAVTVLLSVMVHGLSAAPLASRYGRATASTGKST